MMSYNLYRGGADSRVRQTSAQSYAARDIRDYTCRNVQQDLAVAWNNITSLNQRMPFLRDHEVATAVRDAYRQQFQIGQRTLLDLLNTENELFESRRALTNAQYDLKLAQYRWLALARALPALSLQPARNEMPEENGKLVVSDEVIKQCNSTVPDATRLAPVRVQYNEGTLPPTLVPVNASGADGARARKPGRDSGLGKGGHMATENNGFHTTDFVRVLEDLIDALIANGTLRLTDLPVQAQQN